MLQKFLNSKGNKEPKIKEDFYQLLTQIESYPLKVKERIFFKIGYSLEKLILIAEECESPIEVLLAYEIEEELQVFNERSEYDYYLHKQAPIILDDKTYRTDLLLAPILHEFDTSFPNLIIECDGHEFHEKTKDQAQRDKQRERDLQSAGYRLLRFTGSEIYKNPRKCSREVFNFLKQVE